MTDAVSHKVVLARREGAIGHVVLNRPGAMNAITVAVAQQLEGALAGFADDADVKAVVIRGAGGNFSVGGDFQEVERLRAGGPDALAGLFTAFGRACAAVAKVPAPVVAAVEGYAMAGGFELMQACDVALVRSDAKLADNHANFGQVPGGGGSQRLPRLVGRQRALGHILSGERLSGEQAVAWGLAYRAYPAEDFEAGVEQFAAKLAGKRREALAKIKLLVHTGLRVPLEEGLDLERSTVVDHIMGDSAGAEIAGFTQSKGAGT